MSISAISNHFAAAIRRGATHVGIEAVEPVRAPMRIGRENGRKHELVQAMNDVLGVKVIDGEQGKSTHVATMLPNRHSFATGFGRVAAQTRARVRASAR